MYGVTIKTHTFYSKPSIKHHSQKYQQHTYIKKQRYVYHSFSRILSVLWFSIHANEPHENCQAKSNHRVLYQTRNIDIACAILKLLTNSLRVTTRPLIDVLASIWSLCKTEKVRQICWTPYILIKTRLLAIDVILSMFPSNISCFFCVFVIFYFY